MIFSKKILFTFLLFSITGFQVLSQNSRLIKPLTIGDTVPNLVFDSIIRYHKPTVSLSDFKGQLVILDLWAPSCGSCVADLPRKDSIQKKFKERVVVLPIASVKSSLDPSIIEEWKTITIPTFWWTNFIAKELSLPTILDSKGLLYKYFSIPGPGLQIWIDSNLVIRGLTTEDYVNEYEIEQMLEGKFKEWVIWNRIPFDYDKGLKSSNENGHISLDSFSILLPHKNYVTSFTPMGFDTTNNRKRFLAINNSIRELYEFCFSKLGEVFPYENRIIILTNDSTRFFKGKSYYEEWWARNTFCYEKVTPLSVSDSMFSSQMKAELDHNFSIESQIKLMKVKCLVLKQLNPKEHALHKVSEKNTNSSLNEFIRDLNFNTFRSIPVIIDKGVKENGIHLPIINWNNRSNILNIIKDNGYKLVEEFRTIPMIVISDKRKILN